ncbi:hypothetical protein PVBG_01959 [Plasmodium vivax Brazil I]|uniref:Variable surface protein Vir35 n=2 Tax=Plasmodium vivax TaxID=5855 RepID=A0A0J9VF95_PLAV1|nr:hypothetical protein PVBG_01959 [Plasmodium vivax Brazil I]
MENINWLLLFKIFSFIILIWIYNPYNNVDILEKYGRRKYKNKPFWNVCFNRLLAKCELQRKYEDNRLSEKLSDSRKYKKGRNISNESSIYSQVKKEGLNNFDLYMEQYKRRYKKKRGFSKLDCHYEKKVLDKIHHVHELSRKMQNDRKHFKRILFKKYGLGFMIFALVPFLGFIFPILFYGHLDALIPMCASGCEKGHTGVATATNHVGKSTLSTLDKYTWELIDRLNFSFFYMIWIFYSLFIIYILIKFIKYEGLMLGMHKMSIKEYFRLCKDIFLK